MRKRTQRRQRPAVVPCLIAVGLNDRHEAGMLAAIDAFRTGHACTDNFLDLCDTRDITVIGYRMSGRPVDGIEPAMEAARIALENIRDRRQETGRFGVSGDELAALQLLATTYQNFWAAQSGDLYRRARKELYRLRRYDQEAA